MIDAGEFDRGVEADAFATTFIAALEGALLAYGFSGSKVLVGSTRLLLP